MITIASKRPNGLLFLFFLVLTSYSCSSDDPITVERETEIVVVELELDEEIDPEPETEPDETTSDDTTGSDDTDESDTTDEVSNTVEDSCTNPSDFIFNEDDGLVVVEFESAAFEGNWTMKNNGNNFSGDGYLVWEGPQYFNDPGNGVIMFKIKITNPGAYQFIWRNGIKAGNDGTEHNDTWLRFNDADDFYGKKGNSIVYPNDTGKTPNPKGASKDGWFKIYRSGSNLDFKWQSRTSDHDAHDVFVKFDAPGTYLMEVSARSSNHALDKFVLFNSSWAEAAATSSTELSDISCD